MSEWVSGAKMLVEWRVAWGISLTRVFLMCQCECVCFLYIISVSLCILLLCSLHFLISNAVTPLHFTPLHTKPIESMRQEIVTVQLAACFTSPIIGVLDIAGILQRNVVGPLLAGSQEELNRYWSGTKWALSERYTGVAKIVSVSLFYAMLTPISVIIAAVAFLLVFVFDRFMLLRQVSDVFLSRLGVGLRVVVWLYDCFVFLTRIGFLRGLGFAE